MDIITLETYVRLRWFVKLRWAAITGTAVTAILFEYLVISQVERSQAHHIISWKLLCILLVMIFYNIIFGWLAKRLPLINYANNGRIFSPSGFANLQIGLDLVSLTLLWHFHGGIENPIMFFFVFHMIIASILLPKFNAFLWALFSSFFLTFIGFLEYSEAIYHYPILYQFTGIALWQNIYWNVFILAAFCFTMMCVVFMTSSISVRLRERNEEIIRLEKEISNRKLQDTEKKLFFSEKMAALGKLAAGMAHEINNPLTTILSYSECLEDEVRDKGGLVEDVRLIISETIRIREIVKKVLNFAKAGDQTIATPVNIREEITETINMVMSQMQFINICFQLDFPVELPPAKIGKEHLRQIVINLLVNSAQAMAGKGKITVDSIYLEDSEVIQVKFRDTGPGIPRENLSRVFDPFFTTKAQGEGTGLGLAVSYGLAKMYEGNLTASNTEKGAEFVLSVPAGQVSEP